MKALISLLVLAAMNANSATVLWVGIDDSSTIDYVTHSLSISDWISSLPCLPEDAGARILVDGAAMPAGHEDPSGYIPPGQTAPSIVFDDDISEFSLVLTDTDANPIGYADWQPIRLDNSDPGSHVRYEIGYWDETRDWEFVPLAYASAQMSELLGIHTYESGSLAPPTQTPWRPTVFNAVPEPSSAMLLLAGMLLLVKRRKTTNQKT